MVTDRQIRLFKAAFTPMPGDNMAGFTPQAMAGGAPPVSDPSGMAPAGAPMSAGMPSPVDPAATGMPQAPGMAPAPAMDPTQAAPMPQQPQASTGDMVIDMLLSMGVVMVDGQTGTPIPPEAISQIVTEMANQLGQGAPEQPPTGAPAEGAPSGDTGMMAIMETLAQMDSNISTLRDKIDSLRNIVEDKSPNNQERSAEADSASMDAEVQQLLDAQAARGNVQPPAQGIPQGVPAPGPQMDLNSPEAQLQLLQAMQTGQI